MKKDRKTNKEEDQNTDESTASTLGSMISWGVCICMVLVGLAFLITPANIFYVFTGILSLLLAAVVCPYITARTKEIPYLSWYDRHKAVVVISLAVLLVVMLFLA